jgi:hypothetical protein
MDIERTNDNPGDQPQWLGSLVRRGDELAAATSEPVFDAEAEAQWLGSVARREAEIDAAAAGWTGSAVRATLFSAPTPGAEAAPVEAPAPVPVPVMAPNVQALPARERIVMGALGMTLRVAA